MLHLVHTHVWFVRAHTHVWFVRAVRGDGMMEGPGDAEEAGKGRDGCLFGSANRAAEG